MKVVIDLKHWQLKDIEGEGKKLVGQFVVKAGPVEVATQGFNEQYNGVKIPFSNQLLADIDALTERVKTEITKNFTGEETK